MTQESTIEGYLVKRVKALGGIALKGAVPGRRFIDRICILPSGVTLWIEVKRPKGGNRTALQEHTIEQLISMRHLAFFVKTKDEVDLVLDGMHMINDRRGQDHPELLVGAPTVMNGRMLRASTPKGLVLVR
jgi:hypothetical protein